MIMNNLLKDIRYGIRSLLRHPAFTVVAVITLALGIGANTAIFSVVNAVLLKALPFRNPDRLVSVGRAPGSDGMPGTAAFEYLAWHEKGTTLDDVAAYSSDNFNLTGQGEPERISGAQVTASFFTTLGVAPLRGRAFLQEEDQPGEVRWFSSVKRFGNDGLAVMNQLLEPVSHSTTSPTPLLA
jgi:putative ABC transport system permease protein